MTAMRNLAKAQLFVFYIPFKYLGNSSYRTIIKFTSSPILGFESFVAKYVHSPCSTVKDGSGTSMTYLLHLQVENQIALL